MADGVLFNIAGKLLDFLSQPALEEVALCWGVRDDLKRLEDSIRMISARVRDAEKHHENEKSDSIKAWLQSLRQVLYKAEDLFDEVLTVDQLNKLPGGNKLIKKVRVLLSKSGPIYFNIKVAREIKSIRQELDAIKSNMAGLKLRFYDHDDEQPLSLSLRNKRETSSFVRAETVIGRENDKERIIELLLDPDCLEGNVSVIPIVGIGGLGKTTLAQLVFDNDKVKKHFDAVYWVCVSEVDNLIEVIGRIFRSFTGRDYHCLSLDELKSGIRESIKYKKYLLVLDDIWDDSRDRWIDVKSLLECGQPGSKVIVTTRSSVVAKVIGTIPNPYMLGLLTDDASWDLFKSLAFKLGQQDKSSDQGFIRIGKEIIRSCGNVPLAIRVIGSLLYSKESEAEWQSFRDVQLSKAILSENNDIMPVLKLSYDCLPPALKQCFAYCSLFPKDIVLRKGELVHLWMAQGYLEPCKEGLSLEEVGDQYFLELLWRNFFEEDQYYDMWEVIDDYKVYKMHDLIHDLAQHVSGDETILVDKNTYQCNNQVLHVACLTNLEEISQLFLTANRLRSLLWRLSSALYLVNKSIGFPYLRALELNDLNIESIPSCIGEMRHLRLLSLQQNRFLKYLPDAITRLVNL